MTVQLLLTQQGRNREIASKLLRFIRIHAEAFLSILKSNSREIYQRDLGILRSFTLLLSETAKHDNLFEEIMQIYAAQFTLLASNVLFRISRQQLLPLRTSEEITVDHDPARDEINESVAEIFRNLLSFVRAMSSLGKEDILYLLFQPEQQVALGELEQMSQISPHRSPPITMLFIYLRDLIGLCRRYISRRHSLLMKQNRIDELDMDEISDYLKQSYPDPTLLNMFERRQVCLTELSKLASYCSRMIDDLLSKPIS